jgi:hypothetical protein
MRIVFFLLLTGVSTAAGAQFLPRGGFNEWGMHLFAIIGSTDYDFDGGAAARNDGGAGIGLSLTRNLNNYFAVGLEGTLAQFNYRASIAPGAGNAGARFEANGDMESAALRAHATWNLISGPWTPFLSVAAGVIFLDPELTGEPPANACWVYPFHGQVCGDKAPQTSLTRLTYGAGAGLRYDLPGKQGYVRGYVGGEWIEFSEASSMVGYPVIRADFGVRF